MNLIANEVFMEQLVTEALASLRATEDMVSFCKCATASVNQALAKAVSVALEHFDEELFVSKDSALKSKGKESRKLLEAYGEMSFRRRRYSINGQNIYLLDEVLALPRYTNLSASTIQFLAMRARTDSYESATRDLEELSQVKVSRSTVKTAIERTAQVLKEQEQHCLPVREKVAIIDVESDDILVPLQRTKEQKRQDKCAGKVKGRQFVAITVVKGYEGKEAIVPSGGRKRCVSPFYITSARGTEDAFERAGDYIEKHFDTKHIRHIHFGTDGASNQRKGKDFFPAKVLDSIDPYHAWRKLYGYLEEDVYYEIKSCFYKKDLTEIKAILVSAFDYYQETKQFGYAKNICEASRYINKNALFILRGIARSLGTAESANAHIVADRCKGRGRAWSVNGAENITVLNAAVSQGISLPHACRKQTEPKLSHVIEQNKQEVVRAAKGKFKALAESHYYNQARLPDTERTKGTNAPIQTGSGIRS